MTEQAIETRCIHGNVTEKNQNENRAVSFPIYQTATFSHITPGHNESGFDYTRESNPTRSRTEEIVASLESADQAIAFSSGMAAISACMELFSPQDNIICSQDLYGGVVRLHNIISRKNGLDISYVDTSNIENIEKAVTPRTRAIYIETPGNPMMCVTDIRLCSRIAKRFGALLIVDNTFLSPYFQNPLKLGADIVIHSGSKFLSGHNDTIAGFVCTNNKEIGEKLRLISKTTGAALSPFDSWLVMRGIKTLSVRMERQQENARKIAEWLLSQKEIATVYYPGLDSKLPEGQMSGTGSMISFETESEAAALAILKNVKLITFAESLGGTETLITYPMVQTHADVPEEVRERIGINARLLRLSVGLENADDIISDLKAALRGKLST